MKKITEKRYQKLVNEYIELLSLKKYNSYSLDFSIFYRVQQKLIAQLEKIKIAYRIDVSLADSSALPLEEDVEALEKDMDRIHELIIKVTNEESLTVDDFKDTYYWSGMRLMVRFLFIAIMAVGILAMR